MEGTIAGDEQEEGNKKGVGGRGLFDHRTISSPRSKWVSVKIEMVLVID